MAPLARRDVQRWGEGFRTDPEWVDREDLTSHDEEVACLRRWIAQRWELLEMVVQAPLRAQP